MGVGRVFFVVERSMDRTYAVVCLLQVDNCSADGNLLRGREEKWKGKERNERRKMKL